MPYFLKLALPVAGLLLAAGAHAQTANVPDSLRRAGELVGSRPSARRPARAAAPAAADTPNARLLGPSVNLASAGATALPGLYEHFIGECQAQRHQWGDADWDAAAGVLASLNQRYEQVRTSLTIQERLNIRSAQAEFHTLKGARQLKERLND